MPNTSTLVYFFALALVSFALAAISILWLLKVRKLLSTLSKIALEFDDAASAIPAADKTESLESRIAGCETTIDEIASKVRQVEDIIKTHAVDLANTSEKIASYEHRFEYFESSLADKLNQAANKNQAGLAEVLTSVNALKDKIEDLEKFRTIIQKTHTIIQAAFADMRTSASAEKDPAASRQTAEPEVEALRWSQDEQQEAVDQQTSETEAYHYP
jgi:chromosome segregation ATPase